MRHKKIPYLIFFISLLSSVYAFGTTSLTTCVDLQNMKFNLNGDYILSNDIDCSGFSFIPVGTKDVPFTGILDGAGHKIKNLNINQKNDNSVGLFGATKEAVIRNVRLENAHVLGAGYAGALIGMSYHTVISGVSSSGDVNVIQIDPVFHPSSSIMGGLVGALLDNSFLEKAYSSANVSLKEKVRYSDTAGGLVGQMQNASIEESHASGDVRGNDAGGLVGEMRNGSITHSYATGKVNASALTSGGPSGRIGGLVGYVIGSDPHNPFLISQSYSTGDVGTEYPSSFIGDMGGFIGTVNTYSQSSTDVPNSIPRIENNFSTGEVHARLANAGGLIGSVLNNRGVAILYLENNYSTGKVTSQFPSGAYNCYVGGFIGRANFLTEYIINNYWDMDTSGQNYSDGGYRGGVIGKKTYQMYQRDNYLNWNFDGVWGIQEGQGYPFLLVSNEASNLSITPK